MAYLSTSTSVIKQRSNLSSLNYYDKPKHFGTFSTLNDFSCITSVSRS
ncbi:hypothetical protein XNC3_2090002 [Xenorhabdus nematophila F1]|nr:hypothetical protein XNC3_2090002 [Xenorhabdus nematophila F1]CEE92692.1 hypothetical protein XNA1_3020013 [Xenorhabdus nematophila str. Anatoliense]